MLRNYIYVDELRLNRLAEQVRTRKKQTVKQQKKIQLSITGLGVELSEESGWAELSTHEKIEGLLEYLRKAKLLNTSRPMSTQEGEVPTGPPFILETMQARRVIIPTEHLKAASGVKHLAVWVSDPDPAVYKHEDWVWLGTFVYLTEMWLDDSTSLFWSGCSALQAVVNAVEGKPLGTRNGLEPFGREDSKHPVRKLIGIGAIASDERRITSLYVKRAITNEQCYTWNGEVRRVNDLLGYPIFIADGTDF